MPLIKVKWVWARMGGWKYMMSKRPYEEKEKCIFTQFYLNGVCFDLTLNQGECCINSKIPDFDICIACLRFLKRLGYFQLRRTFRKTFEISKKKNPPKNPKKFWEQKHGHHFQRSVPRYQLTASMDVRGSCFSWWLTMMIFLIMLVVTAWQQFDLSVDREETVRSFFVLWSEPEDILAPPHKKAACYVSKKTFCYKKIFSLWCQTISQ